MQDQTMLSNGNQGLWKRLLYKLIIFQVPIIIIVALGWIIINYIEASYLANNNPSFYIDNARLFHILRSILGGIRNMVIGISAFVAFFHITKISRPEDRTVWVASGIASVLIILSAVLMICVYPIEGGIIIWLFALLLALIGGFIYLVVSIVLAVSSRPNKSLSCYIALLILWVVFLYFLPVLLPHPLQFGFYERFLNRKLF